MRKILAVLIFLILPLITFAQTNYIEESEITSAKGIVLEVEEKTAPSTETTPQTEQYLKIKLLSGNDKGKTIQATNPLDSPISIKVKKGDKVFLYGETREGETKYYVRDFWHLDGLIIWGIILLALIIILGRKQGLKTIITLGTSLLLIFTVLIPLIQKGHNPILITFLIALAVTLITILILTGFTKKALATIIGTMGGIITAIIFSCLIDLWTKLNGLGTEDSRLLALNFENLNFKGLLFAGIITGIINKKSPHP